MRRYLKNNSACRKYGYANFLLRVSPLNLTQNRHDSLLVCPYHTAQAEV